MTSKAERKRRRKAAKISLPGGQQIAQRQTGRDRTHTNQPQEDARMTALQARCRVSGHLATPEELRASTAPLRGSMVGLCIEASSGSADEQAALWGEWQSISAVREAYRMRYLGTTGRPQAAAIAMLPERFETNASLRVDLRTPDEKDRAACAANAALCRRIDALPVASRIAVWSALDGFSDGDDLWRNAKPTRKGLAVVAGLALLVGMQHSA